MMLADLAFAARPPPVITPEETAGGEGVANGADTHGLGSLSPSNFSPGTMMQQLLATPGSAAWNSSAADGTRGDSASGRAQPPLAEASA